MNDRWDLSYLYKGFDDETFRRDLASLEEETKKLQAILDDESLSPKDRLEKYLEEDEKFSARVDALANFIMCTQAVDASNEAADAANDQLMTAYGHDNTATSDSILGVKYIVTDRTYPVHGAYEKVSEGDMDVYRNPYALTLAVGCDNFDVSGISDLVKNRPDMKMPHVPDVDAFALQEDIYSRILGKEVSIFNRSQVQAGEMYQTEDKYNIDYNKNNNKKKCPRSS